MNILIQRFLRYLKVEKNLSDNTFKSYQFDLNRFCNFIHSKNTSIEDVKPQPETITNSTDSQKPSTSYSVKSSLGNEPLSQLQQDVYDAILSHPKGIQGTALSGIVGSDPSTVRTHAIQELTKRGLIKNKGGIGYYPLDS